MDNNDNPPPGGTFRRRTPYSPKPTTDNVRSHVKNNAVVEQTENNSGEGQRPTTWTSSFQHTHGIRPSNQLTPAPLEDVTHEAGKYYCQGCIKARTSKKFGDRVENLLVKTLPCTACKTHHPLIRFSPSQRSSNLDIAKNRVCIAHEGRLKLCEHVSISQAETMEQMAKVKWHACRHPAFICQHPDHDVPFNLKHAFGEDQKLVQPVVYLTSWPPMAEVKYEMNPTFARSASAEENMEVCLLTLREAISSCNGFCPHFKTNPELIFQPESWENEKSSDGDRVCRCPRCRTEIWVRLQGPRNADKTKDPAVSVQSLLLFRVFHDDWIHHTDPESYGHFLDNETKNITWCDDARCTTTYKLGTHYETQFLDKVGGKDFDSACAYLGVTMNADGSFTPRLTPNVGRNPPREPTRSKDN